MSETQQELNQQTQTLLTEWTAALAQVLESMADQKPDVKWESGITLASDPEALWWEQPFQIAPQAIVWVAAPQMTWEHAGTIALQAAGLETIALAEAKSTWLEILGQSLGSMARSIGATIGREVSCEPGIERAPSSIPEIGAAVSIRFADTALPPLWIGLSRPLIAILSAPPAPPPAPQAREDETVPEPAEVDEGPRRRSSTPPTMDLILDVELPVSISFGKTELAMKDVLKLTTGSIVELNRGINDPVEVMVNHCLIARGEVVVVEGNYGVRIREIASRMERMRSIR